MSEVKRKTFVADDGKGSYERVRKGSRAILIKDGKLLLGYEKRTGYHCIPGGGHEEGETLEETCAREIAEETGILVEVGEKAAIVRSCWKDLIYENHFFFCSYKGETALNQTDAEARDGLTQKWVTIQEAKMIFEDTQARNISEHWMGCYVRDSWVMNQLFR